MLCSGRDMMHILTRRGGGHKAPAAPLTYPLPIEEFGTRIVTVPLTKAMRSGSGGKSEAPHVTTANWP
jgi:hypothetical protein